MKRWFYSLGGWIVEKLLNALLPLALRTVPGRLAAALAAVAGPQLRAALDLTTLTPAQRSALKVDLAARLTNPNHVPAAAIGDMRVSEVTALVEALALGVQELALAKLTELNVTVEPTALAPTYLLFVEQVELA